MNNHKTLLSLKNLSVSIANKTICNNLNIQFNAGESWAILGRNGSGKTTLLHTLAGLRSALSGQISINQKCIQELSRKQIARQLGVLLQDNNDNFPSTVLETTLIGRHPHINTWQWGSAQDKNIALQALQMVDMAKLADRNIEQLSGGEQQRVHLATLLSQRPDIYLLDEPDSHLDLHYQIKLLENFRQISTQENKLVIMCIHDINLAARFCDHFLMLLPESKVLYGHKKDILNQKNLESVYQYPFDTLISNNRQLFIPA